MEWYWWVALATVSFIAVWLSGYRIGYVRGTRREATRTTERIEADRLARRNRLRDRGRTTDRRPEHDGQASRVRPIHVTQYRVVPGDQRQPRM